MPDFKRIYNDLPSFQKIRTSKKRRVKSLKRKEELSYIELNLQFGSVWGVFDRSVPFDRKREEDDYKSTSRPTLVLKTPDSYEDYSEVTLAPGTSKYHNNQDADKPCLVAEVPPENLKKTTYFLIYFSWSAKILTLDKKLTELSVENKNRLTTILGNYS